MKETAIESCRKWKNAGQTKSIPIYAQYKKTNYCIKSAFEKSRLSKPVISPMTCMKLCCANLIKNLGKFGNLSFLVLLLTLFRLMVLLTVPLLPPISRGALNQHVSHSVPVVMRPLKPNIMRSDRNFVVRH